MKRYLQGAQQHKWSSNNAWPATKKGLMINPLEAWNAIYNARSTTNNPPTSPNAAPATKSQAVMIHPLKTWNATYNARSSTNHPPTSPNIPAPATKNRLSWAILFKHETLFTMREAAGITLQPEQILRLQTWNTAFTNAQSNLPKTVEVSFANMRPIREWSAPPADHENANRNPPRHRRSSSSSPWSSFYLKMATLPAPASIREFHQMLRLPQKVTHELHQMLHLPRKKKIMINPLRSMKCYLQCAEQHKSSSNVTKCLRLPRKKALMINPLVSMKRYLHWAQQHKSSSMQRHQMLPLPQKKSSRDKSSWSMKR